LGKRTLKGNISIKELAKSRKIMDIRELDIILDLKVMTQGLEDKKNS